jgi:hypothetical protein
MSDPVCLAVLNRLPNRFLPIAFPGMNRNVEILPLNVVKSIYVLLGRVTAFFSGKIEANNSTRAKIDGKFRHFKRYVHIAHGAEDQPRRNSKILAASFQSLQDGRDYVLVGHSFLV